MLKITKPNYLTILLHYPVKHTTESNKKSSVEKIPSKIKSRHLRFQKTLELRSYMEVSKISLNSSKSLMKLMQACLNQYDDRISIKNSKNILVNDHNIA